METLCFRPIPVDFRKKVENFLQKLSLQYDSGSAFTVVITENEEIVATGSREKNVLKCIGVAHAYRGEGLTAKIMTMLMTEAVSSGFVHLFLFTKPDNKRFFHDLGFYPIVKTEKVLLMENTRNGIDQFVNQLECPTKAGKIGCIVANCDPFTCGHLHLIETACRACDFVHLFILSENLGMFCAEDRLMLAKRATAHLPNISVHPTLDYLVSYTTFPDYFLHHNDNIAQINCELDLAIFVEKFAKPLNISRRYMGSEPFSPVTNLYNKSMTDYLPKHGVEPILLPRLENNGVVISASHVRSLLKQGKIKEIKPIVPATTYEFLERAGNHVLCQ